LADCYRIVQNASSRSEFPSSCIGCPFITGYNAILADPAAHAELIREVKVGCILATEYLPYLELRANAKLTDDPTMPCLTCRSMLIGTVFAGAGSFTDTLFAFRQPPVSWGQVWSSLWLVSISNYKVNNYVYLLSVLGQNVTSDLQSHVIAVQGSFHKGIPSLDATAIMLQVNLLMFGGNTSRLHYDQFRLTLGSQASCRFKWTESLHEAQIALSSAAQFGEDLSNWVNSICSGQVECVSS
jgi:hypothetical protein